MYATIKNDRLVLIIGNAEHVIESVSQFEALEATSPASGVMCSSSIHFPADETDNARTIELVTQIFGVEI